MITAILLAAGSASRFGAQKLLQDLHGKPVIRWSAESLLGLPIADVVVVVPPDDAAFRSALTGLTVRFVANPAPEDGMGRSLACGISALHPGATAALISLADEPIADRTALMAVIERYRAGGVSIVVPRFRGIRGHPELFDRSVFPELAVLTGDQGARAITDRDAERVAFVDLDQPKPIDVDTPTDLSRVRSAAQFTSPSPPSNTST